MLRTTPSPPTGGGGKGKLKAGKKGKDAATTYCANCGEEGDARCGGCGMVHYCRKNIVIKNGKQVNMCQQVRALTSAALLALSPLACQSLLIPGALEVRWPSQGLPCIRRRGRRAGAAGEALQGGGRDGQVPHLPRAAERADAAPMRPLVLHGVRIAAAGEGRQGGVPTM